MDQVEIKVVSLKIFELLSNDLFSNIRFVSKERQFGGNKEVGSFEFAGIDVLLDDLTNITLVSIGNVHMPVS